MTTPASDIVYCPLCDVPHRMAAVVCDGCGQALHAPVNLGELRDECDTRKRNIFYALAVVFGMLVLNVAFVGYVGGFVIATAPLGWLIWNWIRFRALSQRLARASAREAQSAAG